MSHAPTAEAVAADPPSPATLTALTTLTAEIDVRICSLHRVAESLRNIVEDTRQEIPIFNIVTFETRAAAISTLRQLHMDLQQLAAVVARNGATAESLHREELKAAQEGLNRAQTPPLPPPAPLAKPQSQPTPARPQAKPQTQPAPAPAKPQTQLTVAPYSRPRWGAPAAPSPSKAAPWAKIATPVVSQVPRLVTASLPRRPVRVAGDLAVDAIVLPAELKTAPEVFAAVEAGGLHYIPHWNQFAVRIGGCVLHAGLGRIYRGAPPRSAGPVVREAPERVKECRRARCDGAGCRYYHDPEEFAGSTDARNFMADSWHFAPAASPARYGSRRVGSADSIEVDVRAISLEDARRFLHQTAHDVLCAAILWQHVVSPAQNRAEGPWRAGRH